MAGRTDALAGRCHAVLDRHLNARATTPLAVALSGGGDSVALLAMAAAWARRHGRSVLALTVDHGLQPQSGAWSLFAAEVAARVGAAHAVLPWREPKPVTGLSAAARSARHALLAEAARGAGASVVLLGHTADDRLEEAWLRAQGGALGRLRPWAPSPAWPEGRGVFLLRPLLDLRRSALRAWLQQQDLPWIEDPANRGGSRGRARQATAAQPDPPPASNFESSPMLDALGVTSAGTVSIGRRALAAAPDATRALRAILASASGRSVPVKTERVAALLARLARTDPFTATLGGARVEAAPDGVLVVRDVGEAARGGLAPVTLHPGRAVVWDGRFEAAASDQPLRIVPLRGRAAALPQAERRRLSALPVAARGGLPVVLDADGAASCPLLTPRPAVSVRSLTESRLRAALGAVVSEA